MATGYDRVGDGVGRSERMRPVGPTLSERRPLPRLDRPAQKAWVSPGAYSCHRPKNCSTAPHRRAELRPAVEKITTPSTRSARTRSSSAQPLLGRVVAGRRIGEERVEPGGERRRGPATDGARTPRSQRAAPARAVAGGDGVEARRSRRRTRRPAAARAGARAALAPLRRSGTPRRPSRGAGSRGPTPSAGGGFRRGGRGDRRSGARVVPPVVHRHEVLHPRRESAPVLADEPAALDGVLEHRRRHLDPRPHRPHRLDDVPRERLDLVRAVLVEVVVEVVVAARERAALEEEAALHLAGVVAPVRRQDAGALLPVRLEVGAIEAA